jgi:hypothetical protein
VYNALQATPRAWGRWCSSMCCPVPYAPCTSARLYPLPSLHLVCTSAHLGQVVLSRTRGRVYSIWDTPPTIWEGACITLCKPRRAPTIRAPPAPGAQRGLKSIIHAPSRIVPERRLASHWRSPARLGQVVLFRTTSRARLLQTAFAVGCALDVYM